MDAIEEITVAELMPGAWRFSDKNINQTYKGHIQPNQGEQVSAFVKVVDKRELFIESVCAIIGRAAGLPIPKPYLVIMAPDAVVDGGDTRLPLFGLEDAQQPSFRQFITLEDGSEDADVFSAILIQLKAWDKLNGTLLFDELTLNTDRHIGNLLYDGSGDFILIDHGLALKDTSRPDTINTPNIIAMLVADESELSRRRRLKSVNELCLTHYSARKYDLLASKTRAIAYGVDDRDIEFVAQLLSNRINCISSILSQQLGFTTMQNALNL